MSDYDPSWPERFERVYQYVWPSVSHLAVRIDHVGSTSVAGLAAKPIIDMDIVVASERDVPRAIDRLKAIDYEWEGDLGLAGREAFRLVTSHELPEHHLYRVVDRNRAHLDHLLLRDLLRDDPTARQRYAALKRENAQIAGDDRERYTALKAKFVAELLTRARSEQRLDPVTYWAPGPGELNPPGAMVG